MLYINKGPLDQGCDLKESRTAAVEEQFKKIRLFNIEYMRQQW